MGSRNFVERYFCARLRGEPSYADLESNELKEEVWFMLVIDPLQQSLKLGLYERITAIPAGHNFEHNVLALQAFMNSENPYPHTEVAAIRDTVNQPL